MSYASPDEAQSANQFGHGTANVIPPADKTLPSGAVNAGSGASFYPATEEEFANLAAFYQPQTPAQGTPGGGNDFVLPPGWDLPGTAGTETGMTPLPDSSWQAFEGLQSWETPGTGSTFDSLGRRVG